MTEVVKLPESRGVMCTARISKSLDLGPGDGGSKATGVTGCDVAGRLRRPDTSDMDVAGRLRRPDTSGLLMESNFIYKNTYVFINNIPNILHLFAVLR